MDLIEKIQKHPRSHVAQAYKLGQSDSGLAPLLKVAIRYFMMRGQIRISKREDQEYRRVCQKLDKLTK